MGRGRGANLAVALAISGAALFFALRHVSLHRLGHVLLKGHYGWLIPASCLLLAIFALRALFWRQTLSVTRRVHYPSLYASVIVGTMANNILPFRAGEMIRALYARRLENLPLTLLLSTIFIERLFDLVSLSLMLFLFLTTAGQPLGHKGIWVIGGTFGLFAGLYLLVHGREPILRFLDRRVMPLTRGHRLAARLFTMIEEALHGLSSLTSPVLLLRLFVTSLLIWFLTLLFTWLCLVTFDVTQSPVEVTLAFLVFTNLALLLPSSPGGIGVVQLAAVYALAPYHVSDNRAVALSLVNQALVIAVTAILGYLILSRSHLSLSAMREQALDLSAAGGVPSTEPEESPKKPKKEDS